MYFDEHRHIAPTDLCASVPSFLGGVRTDFDKPIGLANSRQA
jgi:hypothetical protein